MGSPQSHPPQLDRFDFKHNHWINQTLEIPSTDLMGVSSSPKKPGNCSSPGAGVRPLLSCRHREQAKQLQQSKQRRQSPPGPSDLAFNYSTGLSSLGLWQPLITAGFPQSSPSLCSLGKALVTEEFWSMGTRTQKWGTRTPKKRDRAHTDTGLP